MKKSTRKRAEREAAGAQPNAVETGARAVDRAAILRLAVPALIVVVTLWLGFTYVSRPAWVFDETYYYPFATAVRHWAASPTLDEPTVNRVFREGNAHPPLPLYFMAATQAVFQAERGDFLIAVRMATVLQFAALALVAYFFAKREMGWRAGVFAAALVIFSPRLFGDALLATYEIPLVLFWVATTIAFYRGMGSRKWAVASGVLLGLALSTKVNAFLLPLVLWPWGLCFHRRKALPAIVATAVIGPAVFFALWPWLWLHPAANFINYIADKFPPGVLPAAVVAWAGASNVAWREAIPTLYFGKAAPSGPAWHYPFVMTLITMPLATLVGAISSGLLAKREKTRRGLVALLWWSVLVQLLVFAFLMKPYDGVRLFAPVAALAAIAAALGLAYLAASRRALALAAALALLSPVAELFVYAPWGLSYYSPIVGGLPGAARLGMEATYYGEAVDAAELRAINERAAPGQTVAYAPMFRNIPLKMPGEYIRYTLLNPDLKPVPAAADWDFLIWVNRGGNIEPGDLGILEKGDVICENRLLGVMLSQALERRREPQAGGRDASRER